MTSADSTDVFFGDYAREVRYTNSSSSNNSNIPDRFLGSAAFGFCCVGILAFLGNVNLIYSFCRLRRLQKVPANVYTIHLAANNAILSITSLRIGVKIFWDLDAEDALWCQTEGFMLSVIHVNVMMTIAAMFGERYVVIYCMKSRDSSISLFHYHPGRIILCIWIYSAFWAVWPLTEVVPDYQEERLIPCCIFDRFSTSLMNILYVTSMALAVFILPLLFSGYVMNRIIQVVKNTSARLMMSQGRRCGAQTRSVCSITDESYPVSYSTDRSTEKKTEKNSSYGNSQTTKFGDSYVKDSTTRNLSISGAHTSRIQRDVSQQKKYCPEQAVLRSAFILLFTFVISWAPFLLVCVLNLSGISLNSHLVILAYLFSKASCIHSSYAYATHHHFKDAMMRLKCRSTQNIR